MNNYLIILSRDCRSDDTKTWYGVHRPDDHVVVLYRMGKRIDKHTGKPKMHPDRYIPESILQSKIFRMGTSTYELQDDSNVRSATDELAEKFHITKEEALNKMKAAMGVKTESEE